MCQHSKNFQNMMRLLNVWNFWQQNQDAELFAIDNILNQDDYQSAITHASSSGLKIGNLTVTHHQELVEKTNLIRKSLIYGPFPVKTIWIFRIAFKDVIAIALWEYHASLFDSTLSKKWHKELFGSFLSWWFVTVKTIIIICKNEG